MVALQIREVPDEVRDRLVRQARAKGQSLQAFLLSLVTEESRRARNIEVLQQFEGRSDGIGDADSDAVAEALRQARTERDAQLLCGRGLHSDEDETDDIA